MNLNESKQTFEADFGEIKVIKGDDGFSPIATVEETADGVIVSVTDVNGTTTAEVKNGEKGDTGKQGVQGKKGETGEPGKDGVSPVIEIIPRQNSNVYQFKKYAHTMSSIRWCDAADKDIERTVSFDAKVHCYVPYDHHSFRIQIRKTDGNGVDLFLIGSDGAGNTVVYHPSMKRAVVLPPGWHNYSISWNSNTGAYVLIVDGGMYSGVRSQIVDITPHGLKIESTWDTAKVGDLLAIDNFTLSGDGVTHFTDTFDNAAVGASIPDGWYNNDNNPSNIREVLVDTDIEWYLQITDVNGTKRSGNLVVPVMDYSVTTQKLADGSVSYEKLGQEVQTLLEKLSALLPE